MGDYATIKYHPNGDTAWIRKYNGPGNFYDGANAIVLDRFDNVYVTGYSRGSGTSEDYTTIKYSPNGDTAWVRRYDGPSSGSDTAYALAIDGCNNLYVTGVVRGGSYHGYGSIKYDPNGHELWVKIYAWGGDSRAFAIAVDRSQNIYVTGQSWDLSYDFATIKYSPVHVTDTLKIIAFCPIHMIITAPNGDSISPWFPTTIKDATYDTLHDWNGDSELDDSVTIPNPLVGEYQIRVLSKDKGKYSIGVRIDGTDLSLLKYNEEAPPIGVVDTVHYEVLPYLRGDVNKDNITDIGDIVFLINYVFYSGVEPYPIELGDANCDAVVDIGDIVHLINFVFYQGPPACS